MSDYEQEEEWPLWDEGSWVDGYAAKVNEVFAGGDSAWIDFSWQPLLAHQGTGHVGWRQLVSEDPSIVASMLGISTAAKSNGWRLRLRVTNDGRIVGLMTMFVQEEKFELTIDQMARLQDRVQGFVPYEG